MLKLQSPYTPFVLQQMQLTPPQSAINLPSKGLKLNPNPHGDTFVKVRSGNKYPGFESRVNHARKMLEQSYTSELAQALKTHAQAWINALEHTLNKVNSEHETTSAERSMATAREHLEMALRFIQED